MSHQEIEAWAWDIKEAIPEQKYIELMDILSKSWKQGKFRYNHRVKVVIQTAIKEASDDWLELNADEYDEAYSYEDDLGELHDIETSMIFNVRLNDILKHRTDYSLEDVMEGKDILRRHIVSNDYMKVMYSKQHSAKHKADIEEAKNKMLNPYVHIDTSTRINWIEPYID